MMRLHYSPIVLLCLACFISACAPVQPGNPFTMRAREPLPALTLVDRAGQLQALDEGRWRIINLWATWCSPCVKELPDLHRLALELAPLEAEVVVVAVNSDAAEAQTLLDSLGVSAVHDLYDADNAVMATMQPRGIPTTYLVDPSNAIVGVAEGFKEWTAPETLVWFRRTLQRVGTGVSPE